MASLKSMHVFLPLSIGFFLCLHVVAAHRKLNINERLLMSSSTFYNAFDPKNTNAFDANHINTHNTFSPSANKDGTNANSENSANRYSDIDDSEFSTNPYTNSHSYNAFNPNSFDSSSYSKNANLPLSTSNTHQANGVHSFPNTNEFSSPSSSSTPSRYAGKFPNSYEASLPDARNEYNKQSFPSNDQPNLYGSHDAKSLFYGSPSREQALSQSSLNYQTTSYNPFYQFDEPKKGNNHVSDVVYKNEKPVTNYDKFFNTPTIHKNEVEGSATSSQFVRPQFPVSDHDLTYGHVQVP
ncbi:hypothetical protein L7F22_042466 [Adiantum nelumboides]|nr:hypothetical protein [Adiantum nelumboides]